jgi:hypothetical protein
MSIFFSPTTGGFYDTDAMHYPKLPEDRIEVTAKEREFFLEKMNMESMALTYENGELVLVPQHHDATWDAIRTTRNCLLDESDFTQVSDFSGDKEAWKKYRQQLRDLPQLYSDPNDIVWPEKPKNNG